MRWLNAIDGMLDGGSLAGLLHNAPFGFALADLERIAALPASALALPADAHRFATKSQAYIIAQRHRQVLRKATLAALGKFHASSPEEPGVEIARLRRMAAPAMPEAPWRALVDELIAEHCLTRNGPWLHLPEHRVALSAQEMLLAEKLAPLLDAGAFDPPWIRDLAKATAAAEADVRRTLRKLARSGAVHQIVPDLFYAAARVRELAVITAQLAREHGDVTAATFRDRVGLGRKRAIQILEFFDRVGYTRRVHEAHRLRGERQDFF
jgi:selenocysteine-specific elongation factor